MKRKRHSRREIDEKYDDEAYMNEVLYKEGYQPSSPRKKPKKRQGVFLGILTTVLGIVIIVLAFLLLFHVQKIEVKGIEYCTENDVVEWLKEDKYAVNTVYAWWKYNYTDVEQLPSVKSAKVTLRNPWTIRVTVKEKQLSGYIDYDSKYLYFDKEGTASLVTTDKLANAAYIEGMDVDASKVKLGKVLPVSDKAVFKQFVEISRLLVKYSLSPDRITCSGNDISVYFGEVEVQLGSKNYEERLAQVPPILQKLNEKYPDTAGILHLENYDSASEAIRFVPKTEDTTTQDDTQAAGDTAAQDDTQTVDETAQDTQNADQAAEQQP